MMITMMMMTIGEYMQGGNFQRGKEVCAAYIVRLNRPPAQSPLHHEEAAMKSRKLTLVTKAIVFVSLAISLPLTAQQTPSDAVTVWNANAGVAATAA